MTTARSSERQTPLRVFIVEDEALICWFLEDVLVRAGFAICGVAAKANHALKRIPDAKPDVILMDIHLSAGGNGLAVAAELGPAYASALIYVSAYRPSEWQKRFAIVEPVRYLSKPIDEQALLRMLAEIAETLPAPPPPEL